MTKNMLPNEVYTVLINRGDNIVIKCINRTQYSPCVMSCCVNNLIEVFVYRRFMGHRFISRQKKKLNVFINKIKFTRVKILSPILRNLPE